MYSTAHAFGDTCSTTTTPMRGTWERACRRGASSWHAHVRSSSLLQLEVAVVHWLLAAYYVLFATLVRRGAGRCPKSLRRGRPWSPLTRTCGVNLPAPRLGLLGRPLPLRARTRAPRRHRARALHCCTRSSLQTAYRSLGSRPPGSRVPRCPATAPGFKAQPPPLLFVSGAALISRSLCVHYVTYGVVLRRSVCTPLPDGPGTASVSMTRDALPTALH